MKYFLGLNSETDFNFDLFSLFEGVGMIRGENLCINKMQYFTVPEFREYVTKYLIYVAQEFNGKKVWYRTADLVPHQINLLEGCDKYVDESQYLIGVRGIRRNLAFPDTYDMELSAFMKAYKEQQNLNLLIPFISNIDELKIVKSKLDKLNYKGLLGVMIEIPAMIFMLDELNKLGVDNFTIGVNDLTTMILGSNRDIDEYNIMNKAVLKAINYTIKKIHSFGKEVTIAGYLNPDIINFLQKNKADIINIHYNEIPLIFDVQNEEFYTKCYSDIKRKYKRIKYERNGNTRI